MSKEKTNPLVAIVIPAYNEAPTIDNVLKDIRTVFANSTYAVKIIVVDDGSSDLTAVKVSANKDVVLIRHILNTGAGGATATGLSYAEQNGFETAVTMDADGQHAAKDILKGLDVYAHKSTDLLIGSRLIDSRGMSKVKILGNKGLSLITRVLFGVQVTDSQSGLRILSRRALEQLKWKTTGYEFCSEMLWRAHQLNLEVDEYPIEAIYTEYSRSKGQNNWNAYNIIKSLIKRRLVEIFS